VKAGLKREGEEVWPGMTRAIGLHVLALFDLTDVFSMPTVSCADVPVLVRHVEMGHVTATMLGPDIK
jgi:hypothetical protein